MLWRIATGHLLINISGNASALGEYEFRVIIIARSCIRCRCNYRCVAQLNLYVITALRSKGQDISTIIDDSRHHVCNRNFSTSAKFLGATFFPGE